MRNKSKIQATIKAMKTNFWLDKNCDKPKLFTTVTLHCTVKLGIKELLNKEQIGFKEVFTDYHPFYTINLLLIKELWQSKGQLVSKCSFEKSVSSKIPTKIFLDLCPEFFVAFWGLFGLPVAFLIYDITQKASRKPLGSYKKFQGRIPEIFLLVFWMKMIFHQDILKSTDL